MRLQKYQRSKLEIKKKLPVLPDPGRGRFESGRIGNFVFNLQLWPLILLQPLDLQEQTVPHLKDLIHISLDTDAQVRSQNSRIVQANSKYPHFTSYRGKTAVYCEHSCICTFYWLPWSCTRKIVPSTADFYTKLCLISRYEMSRNPFDFSSIPSFVQTLSFEDLLLKNMYAWC